MMNIFCNTIGTGVPGIGIAIYAPIEINAAKRHAIIAFVSLSFMLSIGRTMAKKYVFVNTAQRGTA
ncbi:hypothetical protein SPIROBIBN47_240030 [uncultured spirochete]|jgi:hypothetical protein|uniref:Uncharacterized protein n=1 Tax=uncultured spirochete TaxID=156406 RepID=A0A3P3XHT1_9SPIR|nr:hypothetical protein SPIROBIBN47_240030 [uncultured spirochete]